MPTLPKVLFACTYKGGRSQIAHAYAEKHGGGVIESKCACFDPDMISKEFVQLASSMGLQVDVHSPHSVFNQEVRQNDYLYVICMCSSVGTEMCSLFKMNIEKIFPNTANRLHWDIPDFGACAKQPDKFEDCVREVCKTIESQTLQLIESIKAG